MNRQRAKASLGLASTILKLKELLAEEFLRLSFIFKVNPDGVFVKTQNILYICLYGEPETLLHFFFPFFCLTVFSVLEEGLYTTGRRTRTEMYPN